MKNLSPYQHVLNSSGTACEDGTSCAGATPCPACRWAREQNDAENNCFKFDAPSGRFDSSKPNLSNTPKGDEQDDWETPCPAREDGAHCDHWYDGEACCDCHDPADPEVGGPREATGAIWPDEGSSRFFPIAMAMIFPIRAKTALFIEAIVLTLFRNVCFTCLNEISFIHY
jgi:hypothetical protein